MGDKSPNRKHMLTKEAQLFAELGRAVRFADFARLVRAYEREFKRDGQGRFSKVNVNSAIKQQARKIKAEASPAYDYIPSEAVRKMMTSKRTKLEKLNDVVRGELVGLRHFPAPKGAENLCG